MLVDTHCHLDTHYFPEGPAEVMDRARAAGVGAFVVIGVGSLEAAQQAVELATGRADVTATVGVHPHDAAHWNAELESALLPLMARVEVTALGEAGLDYHYDHSPRDVQARVFRRQIALCRELRKPLVVHTREAAADTLAILEEERADEVGGVIHCFSEDWPFAERALALGFDLSFSGIVTFKKAEAIQEVARRVPADRYLVETDSPYLAPMPHRGKRCEPAYVALTAAFIGKLRGESAEQVAADTTRNARRRFSLPA